MRIYRLAQLLEDKYSLQSSGAPVDAATQVKNDAINGLINNFKLYVDPQSGHNKNPVLGILANMEEPHTTRLLERIHTFIKDLKSTSPGEMIEDLNEILAMMYQIQKDKSEINNFVIDNFKLGRQADKNYRDRIIQKYWSILSIIFSVYQKTAIALQALSPDAVHGGKISPQRGELSRDKYVAFMRGPAAQMYGLNSLEILRKVLEDPELKGRLVTLINAVDRGHAPLDGPAVAQGVREIMDVIKSKEKTNAPFFESNEPVPQAIEPEEEKQ